MVNNLKMSHDLFSLLLPFAFFCCFSDSHFVLFFFASTVYILLLSLPEASVLSSSYLPYQPLLSL